MCAFFRLADEPIELIFPTISITTTTTVYAIVANPIHSWSGVSTVLYCSMITTTIIGLLEKTNDIMEVKNDKTNDIMVMMIIMIMSHTNNSH